MNKKYIFIILTFVKSFGVSAGRYIDIVNNNRKSFYTCFSACNET